MCIIVTLLSLLMIYTCNSETVLLLTGDVGLSLCTIRVDDKTSSTTDQYGVTAQKYPCSWSMFVQVGYSTHL